MKKTHDPLLRRIPREFLGDWRKYLVVCLFLVLTISFVSGMYVANGSMLGALHDGVTEYKREDGHFELKEQAPEALLAAIETGEKANVKQYYLDKAQAELDEKLEGELRPKFDEAFSQEFEAAFRDRVKAALLATGLDETTAETMTAPALARAKADGSYEAAYAEAYEGAYTEAYHKAYEEAWDKVLAEIEEKYADAAKKYELDDPDFTPVRTRVYPNFFRNETVEENGDGVSDGTVRVYTPTEDVNKACLLKGRFPETAGEIAIDRMHADNVGLTVGDSMTVGGQTYEIVGLLAYVNYTTLHEKTTDLMFDALKFDVAMMTQEGFDRLSTPIHYGYAFQYEKAPADEKEEKAMSDDFLRALLTQTVTADNEIADYVPGYANPAVTFAPEDMGSDEAMGGVLLDILMVIIAFIFAVTVSNTITRESSAIGTLRALGYTRRELTLHYLAMPMIVTLLAACLGNLLGYTVMKRVVVGMYYNSYSLPDYRTLWNPSAFGKTTLIPLALMLVVNLFVISRMLRHTPLQFLRHDLKKTKRKKALRLPSWSFLRRFRLRIILQNRANYCILFAGVFFIMVLLAMAVGMPSTLKYYQSRVSDMMFANYQYVLSDTEDQDGRILKTNTPGAEAFGLHALLLRTPDLDEEVSVYGVEGDSAYVEIPDIGKLREGEAYISASMAEKYGLAQGDTVTLAEKYENESYTFTVAGVYDRCQAIALFLPMEWYRTVFGLEDGDFTGYLSDMPIEDLPEDSVATVFTQRDLTKMADQLDHSMGSYMTYFQYLCVLLAAVLIYLLSKLIIEKNEAAISMTKILGYTDREIAGLYLRSTTLVLLVSDAIGVILGTLVMRQAWRVIMATYSGWFGFHMEARDYGKMFLFVLVGYLFVMVLDFRRIRRIPMDTALKNVE